MKLQIPRDNFSSQGAKPRGMKSSSRGMRSKIQLNVKENLRKIEVTENKCLLIYLGCFRTDFDSIFFHWQIFPSTFLWNDNQINVFEKILLCKRINWLKNFIHFHTVFAFTIFPWNQFHAKMIKKLDKLVKQVFTISLKKLREINCFCMH